MKIISHPLFLLVPLLALICGFFSSASKIINNAQHQEQQEQEQHSSYTYTPDPFLQNWMGRLTPVIRGATMNDISVAGSHDSGTYDLSSVFADDANDLPTWLASLLHDFRGVINKLDLGPWIRNQAKTQGLTFTQQLDSGLRFIDFRIDYTAPPNASSSSPDKDWYVMHMMQSSQKAITYLQEMRKWQQEHPSEVVVYWFSHHGTPCATNVVYDVDNAIKQKFWQEVEQLFAGIMFDSSARKLNETTIGELQQLGQTAIFYVVDYQNFTASSKYAQWSCVIDNDLPSDSTPKSNVNEMVNRYQNANVRITGDKKQGKYYLMSGSGPDPKQRMIDAFELSFLAPLHLVNRTELQMKCAAVFDVPGSTWCPQYLQECAQWANYYHQIPFEYAVQQQLKEYFTGKSLLSFRFPNAIYIDGVDQNGTIRTGSQVFWPQNVTSSSSKKNKNGGGGRGEPSIPTFTSPHLDAKYSYTDTLLLSNVLWICSGGVPSVEKPSQAVCQSFIELLKDRRMKYPLQEWTDLTSGRLKNYPPFP